MLTYHLNGSKYARQHHQGDVIVTRVRSSNMRGVLKHLGKAISAFRKVNATEPIRIKTTSTPLVRAMTLGDVELLSSDPKVQREYKAMSARFSALNVTFVATKRVDPSMF